MSQLKRPRTETTDEVAVEFFEGTEKRIEFDFEGEGNLSKVSSSEWEEVVRLSETKILHQKQSPQFVSYLLSESSLIVYPTKVILKTCGRTVPLSSVEKIRSIAKAVGLEPEWLCYSRKNFLAPSEQPAQHQSNEAEVAYCRDVVGGVGDAYILGPLTGEHWLLHDANFKDPDCSERGDLTVDIMMYGLPPDVQQMFFTSLPEGSPEGASEMTRACGLADLAASIQGEIDDYCFSPCGYSCNAHAGDAYFMVHVTPQDECSYASFETNYGSTFGQRPNASFGDSLNTLVRRVLDSFRPEKFTMTLFIDGGATKFIGGAPFEAAAKDYKGRTINSYHFEKDYIATVANFAKQK